MHREPGIKAGDDHGRSSSVTAAAIAKKIGILKDESEACDGASIDGMTDEELQGACGAHIRVCSGCRRSTRFRIVQGLAGKGQHRCHDRRWCK